MPAREVFEMATMEGAKALGIEKDVGSLEVGKKADFVALNLLDSSVAWEPNEREPQNAYSAIVYAASPQCVRETWIDGRSVYRNGIFRGGSESEIVSQAIRERKKLLARLD